MEMFDTAMLEYVMFEINPVVLKLDLIRAPFWELATTEFWKLQN
jgi:hypothetical protein